MNEKLWTEFIEWGSGWDLEAERDYKKKGTPIIYHLRMYGLWYPKNYELVGTNLPKLLKQAIRDGKQAYEYYQNREP